MPKDRRSLHELSAEVATNPDSTAFVELAAAYRERGDLERALRLCLRGIQRHPTHVEAHYELGRIYEQQGDRELALDEWGVVRQLAPDHLPTRLALIRLYLDEGRADDAYEEFERARRLAPSNGALAQLAERVEAVRSDRQGEGEAAKEGRAEGEGQRQAEREWEDEGRQKVEGPSEDSEGQREVEGQTAEESRQKDNAQVEGKTIETTQPAVDPLDALKAEYPGVLGLLVATAEGQLVAGRMTRRGDDSDSMLAATLVGARSEAARVAKYLDLGELRSIAVESKVARLNLSPLGGGLVIVATSGDIPSGQVALIMQRACELAEASLSTGGG